MLIAIAILALALAVLMLACIWVVSDNREWYIRNYDEDPDEWRKYK